MQLRRYREKPIWTTELYLGSITGTFKWWQVCYWLLFHKVHSEHSHFPSYNKQTYVTHIIHIIITPPPPKEFSLFFNWNVQVRAHIKGEKSSEMIYLCFIIFMSQKPGILTRLCKRFISTALDNFQRCYYIWWGQQTERWLSIQCFSR